MASEQPSSITVALPPEGVGSLEPSWHDFALGSLICLFLIITTTAIFYESMRYVRGHINRIAHRPRTAIIVGVLALFACHTICVWLYAITYWVMHEVWHFGALYGQLEEGNFISYLYFSITTYSSLGYGDILPSGPMRLMIGVETINGLILIGWSVTYTYFAAERYLGHEKLGK